MRIHLNQNAYTPSLKNTTLYLFVLCNYGERLGKMHGIKKTSIVFLIIMMTFSLVMVPLTPIIQEIPQVAMPQTETPEDIKVDLAYN